VKNNAALLYIERISYTEYDVPIEYLRLFHRGDRYTLYTELRG
jgi:DNA-binding GntR family transcriptional regulator